MTKDWLLNVAAALIVVSSDRPLSDEDCRLIAEVRQLAPHVWIILRKVGLLSVAQHVEVIAFLSSQLRTFMEADLPVIPFSIRQDRDGNVGRVQNEIFHPLVQDPVRERQAVFTDKVQVVAEACCTFLRIALKAAVQKGADRERLRAAVFDEAVQESVLRDELGLAAGHIRGHIRPTLQKQIHSLNEPLHDRLASTHRGRHLKPNTPC